MSIVEKELINKFFKAANLITLYQMYFTDLVDINNISVDKLKRNTPGHLGTAMSMNFILSNIYYYINKEKIKTKLVISTGHAGVALSSFNYLNGTWEEKNNKYKRNKEGLKNLVNDFGEKIRSEINPEYPNVIYDGGELGYGLAVSYGYAISEDAFIPCIIGDGELETGTCFSSFQLNKLLNVKGNVFPIINLNGLKMGSASYFSKFDNNSIIKFFSLLGYNVGFVEVTDDVLSSIESFQNELDTLLKKEKPLLIVKNKKGYTLPNVGDIIFEGNKDVHKNPLGKYTNEKKLECLKAFIDKNYIDLFDNENNLLDIFSKLEYIDNKCNNTVFNKNEEFYSDRKGIKQIEDYLFDITKNNDISFFSPDELYSNQLGKINEKTFEILNENILQALLQGYNQSLKRGIFIGYEAFMPIISSMVTQYYKYLYQNDNIKLPSLTYFLTSTCWENTYSHQNPGFINSILEKSNSNLYNIYYPKNSKDCIYALNKSLSEYNSINIITKSKRHEDKYELNGDPTLTSETIIECEDPSIILCATGDYMLNYILELYGKLKASGISNIKVNYVTNPNVLREYDNIMFEKLFNNDVPVLYMFTGYSYTIKSLLYGRDIDCEIHGFNDVPSAKGLLLNHYENNGIDMEYIKNECIDRIGKRLIYRR